MPDAGHETGSPQDPREGRWILASMMLASTTDAWEALAAGQAVPRRLLRAHALERLGEPIVGPDFTLTDEKALALELATAAENMNGASDEQEAAQTPLTITPLEEFAAVDEATAEPIVGGEEDCILSLGGMMVLYGDGGAGKTTMELDLVMHLAAGADWLGLTMNRQSRILIIENEGPRGMFRKKLRRKLEAFDGDISGLVFVLEDPWALFSFSEEVFRDHLRAAIVEHQVDIIAAGPVNRLGIQGGGTPEEVGTFILQIELVRQSLERPVAVIFAHHENKTGDVSGAWEGVPDTLMHVQNQGNGATRLHWQKVRWGPALHGKTWQLLWRDGESFEVDERQVASEDELQRRLDEYLEQHPWTSTKVTIDTVEGNPDRLRTLLKTGVESGRYRTEPGARGAVLYALAQEQPATYHLDFGGTSDEDIDIPLA